MKKLKVLAICGSPRKGNTEKMLQKVLDAAKKNGAETELILLREKKIRHCDGCDICWNYQKPCHIKDDMTEIYNKLLSADTIVLGSPNYFRNVSGMMKVLIDRTNSISGQHKLKGKNAAIVCVGNKPVSDAVFCENILKQFLKDHKTKLIGSVIGRANAPKEIEKNKKTMKECYKLGEKITKLK